MHPLLWQSAGTSREEFDTLLDSHRLHPHPLSGQGDLWSENGQIVLEHDFLKHTDD
jgi:hypothetical protein